MSVASKPVTAMPLPPLWAMTFAPTPAPPMNHRVAEPVTLIRSSIRFIIDANCGPSAIPIATVPSHTIDRAPSPTTSRPAAPTVAAQVDQSSTIGGARCAIALAAARPVVKLSQNDVVSHVAASSLSAISST